MESAGIVQARQLID